MENENYLHHDDYDEVDSMNVSFKNWGIMSPDEISELIDESKKSMDNISKSVGNIIQQTESDIEQSIILGTESKDEIHDKLDKMVEKIEDKVTDVQNKIVSELAKTTNSEVKPHSPFEETLLQIIQNQQDQLQNMEERLRLAERTPIEKMRDTARSVWDAMKNATNATIGFIKDVGQHIKDFGLNVIDAAKTAANTMKTNIDRFFDEKIKQPIRETVQNLRDAVDTAKNTIEKVKVSAQLGLDNAKDKVLSVLTNAALNKLVDVQEHKKNLTDRLNDIKNKSDQNKDDGPDLT